MAIGLRKKILFLAHSSTLVLGLVVFVALYAIITSRFEEELRKKGLYIAQETAFRSADLLITKNLSELQFILNYQKEYGEDVEYMFIRDGDGNVVVHTFEGVLPNDFIWNNPVGKDEAYRTASVKWRGKELTHIAHPILKGGKFGTLHLGMKTERIRKEIASALILFFVIALGIVILGIVLIQFGSRFITRPLSELTDFAGQVQKGNLETVPTTQVKDELGQLASAFNQIITELKQTTVSKDYLGNILNTMKDGLFVLDPEEKIAALNKAALDLLGYAEGELINKPFANLLTDPLETSGLFAELAEKGFIHDHNVMLRTKDNHVIPASFSGSILTAKNCTFYKNARECPEFVEKKVHQCELSRRIGLVCMVRDIHERLEAKKKLEQKAEQLARAYTKLEILNQYKDVFLGDVAHDLKVPILAIRGYLDIILKGEAGEISYEQEEYLKTISRNIHKQVRLIENLNDFSEAYIDRQRLNIGVFDLKKALEESWKTLVPLARQRNIQLEIDLPKRPVWMRGDEDRLAGVFDNIISNGITYNSDGGAVTVGMVVIPGEEALIKVADTGIGIPEDDWDKVFDRFYRIRREHEPEKHHRGIGLSMCREIIRFHGGKIAVANNGQQGSIFIVKLPVMLSRPQIKELPVA
jgi:PAS domain S-box-containing protein